jgi:hypothetical protein
VAEPLTAEQLFEAHFRPIYPPDLRDDRSALVTARSVDANPARNPRLLAELDEIAQVFAKLAPQALGAPSLVLDRTDASVHRLGAALDRKTRDALLAASTPGDPRSPLVNLVIHGAVYVGACVVARHGGAWGVRRPLWESVVHLRSRAGEGALAPFHWWLKALADAEIDRGGLVDRYRQLVERASFDPATLTPIVASRPDRAIPTLRVVRPETLNKHLRAHLPELRGLGTDFPGDDKLKEIGFLELDFLLLGEGRYLLMHGRGKQGLHLFWLDRDGFSHGAFIPASPGDPHSVQVEGDRLVVRFRFGGVEQVHEMLWWG